MPGLALGGHAQELIDISDIAMIQTLEEHRINSSFNADLLADANVLPIRHQSEFFFGQLDLRTILNDPEKD
jgi:hypothetical protein